MFFFIIFFAWTRVNETHCSDESVQFTFYVHQNIICYFCIVRRKSIAFYNGLLYFYYWRYLNFQTRIVVPVMNLLIFNFVHCHVQLFQFSGLVFCVGRIIDFRFNKFIHTHIHTHVVPLRELQIFSFSQYLHWKSNFCSTGMRWEKLALFVL